MSIHAIVTVLDFAPDTWGPGTRLVALALADRVNQDGQAWPSLADIARRSGLQTRMVRRHLHLIEEDGWIRCEGQRINGGGQPVSNLWTWPTWTKVGGQSSTVGGRSPRSAPPVRGRGVLQYRQTVSSNHKSEPLANRVGNQ